MMRPAFLLAAVLTLPLATGCATSPKANPPAPTIRVDSVAVGSSGMGGAPVGPYTFFSLAENRVVPNADSASTQWDLAFLGTTIRFNGGASGPGEGAARLVEMPFEDVSAAPEAALIVDGEGDCGARAPLAICGGSGNGWYVYGGSGVSPVEGQTLVVRLADGSGLAKVRILSYTLSEPLADGSRPRYYAFEHARLR